jgi:hypothetical protein
MYFHPAQQLKKRRVSVVSGNWKRLKRSFKVLPAIMPSVFSWLNDPGPSEEDVPLSDIFSEGQY